jgi:hypothetical protein
MENITFNIEEKEDPKRIKHLKSVSEYQKRNAEKCRTKNKEYYKKLKYLNPEKYKLMLEKKRQYAQKSKTYIEKSNSIYNNQEI